MNFPTFKLVGLWHNFSRLSTFGFERKIACVVSLARDKIDAIDVMDHLSLPAHAMNNPARYTDPSGHRQVEGCGVDGNAHCQPTDLEISRNSQFSAILNRRADEARCRNGNYAHCSGIQGLQAQITLSAGIPTQITNSRGENLSPLLFYGISLVFDKHGGFQLYGLTRDIRFDPSFQTGSAEKTNPMDYAGAGITMAAGTIYGTEFAAKGTEAYRGASVDRTLGILAVSIDHYDLFDESVGSVDGTKVSGDDLGISIGAPVSIGSYAIFAHDLTPRMGLPIQSPYSR